MGISDGEGPRGSPFTGKIPRESPIPNFHRPRPSNEKVVVGIPANHRPRHSNEKVVAGVPLPGTMVLYDEIDQSNERKRDSRIQ